jgi:HEPN domain-containing protein
MVYLVGFDLLKKRALSFLRDAKTDFENGDYDLVLFHVEQFVQLYSKYLMYRKIGDYPKTHSLMRLLNEIVKIYSDCGLKELLNEYLEAFYLLEESYISSRYLPREYDRSIASRILNLSEKLLEVFKCLETSS